MDSVKIGRFLAALRHEQGMTQDALGEKLGVTGKTISRWETGTYLPPAEMLLALSECYGVTVNELLTGQRLTKEEALPAAEDNLARVLRESPFGWREQLAYFQAKWRRKHRVSLMLLAAVTAGLTVAAFVSHRPIVMAAAMLIAFSGQLTRRNRMMAYTERHVFHIPGKENTPS